MKTNIEENIGAGIETGIEIGIETGIDIGTSMRTSQQEPEIGSKRRDKDWIASIKKHGLGSKQQVNGQKEAKQEEQIAKNRRL